MALIDLKSDLSWYGKTPPKGVANNDKNITQFKYNTDLTVSVTPDGQLPRVSADGLPLENGSSTRKAQLGEGTRFPIGPEGQIHQFDIKRTGWYVGRSYSALYNNKVPFGLAASYTNNSPIDDMYNKFKVRDEAYDPFGYAKPPFILRGIQQDGESDPQRWGLAGTALANASMEVPRGGIVASVERAALDAVRLGKFLIRPQGLLFLAKQQLLHLMTPNVENITGYATGIPNTQKLFNPANFLASAIGGVAGLRFKRYGLPFEGEAFTYSGIHSQQDEANRFRSNRPFNRLTELNYQRRAGDNVTGFNNVAVRLSPNWNAISAPLGPDSVGGLGATLFTKRDSYDSYITIPGSIGMSVYAHDALYTVRNPYATSGTGRTLTIQQLDTGDYPDATATTQAYRVIPFYVKSPTYFKFSLRKRYEYPLGFGNSLAELTTFKSQLASHDDFIRGIGQQSDFDVRFKKFNIPYLGTYTPNSPITSDTIAGDDSREDSLESFVSQKTDARKLKDSIVETLSPTFRGGVSQTEDQKIVQNRTNADNIRNYRAMTYGDVRRLTGAETYRGPQNGQLIDFRTGQAWSTSDEYRKNTLENYYGYTPYNAANRKRAKPDPVNNSRYGDELSGVKDLIKFRFESVGFSGTNGKAIIFRAYINSLSDAFSPSWNPSQDQGRADPKVLYASFERTINVDFKVVVHSADEQHNVWDKLSALARNTYPVYAGSGFHGQFIRVTIGDLYVKQYMYVTSLTYDWDQDTPWEITEGVQLPMYTNVNMALNWVGTSKPKAEQIPYSYGGNRIPAVYADVPNNSGNDAYQGEADNSPTPAADDASLNPIPFDAPQEADTDTQAAAAPGTTTAR
jgi:hypothetical protein